MVNEFLKRAFFAGSKLPPGSPAKLAIFLSLWKITENASGTAPAKNTPDRPRWGAFCGWSDLGSRLWKMRFW